MYCGASAADELLRQTRAGFSSSVANGNPLCMSKAAYSIMYGESSPLSGGQSSVQKCDTRPNKAKNSSPAVAALRAVPLLPPGAAHAETAQNFHGRKGLPHAVCRGSCRSANARFRRQRVAWLDDWLCADSKAAFPIAAQGPAAASTVSVISVRFRVRAPAAACAFCAAVLALLRKRDANSCKKGGDPGFWFVLAWQRSAACFCKLLACAGTRARAIFGKSGTSVAIRSPYGTKRQDKADLCGSLHARSGNRRCRRAAAKVQTGAAASAGHPRLQAAAASSSGNCAAGTTGPGGNDAAAA